MKTVSFWAFLFKSEYLKSFFLFVKFQFILITVNCLYYELEQSIEIKFINDLIDCWNCLILFPVFTPFFPFSFFIFISKLFCWTKTTSNSISFKGLTLSQFLFIFSNLNSPFWFYFIFSSLFYKKLFRRYLFLEFFFKKNLIAGQLIVDPMKDPSLIIWKSSYLLICDHYKFISKTTCFFRLIDNNNLFDKTKDWFYLFEWSH